MKQILIIISLLSWFAVAGFAQQENQKGRLEALKIAYLTKQLNLSIQEAQKFWPIYNKYNLELRDVRRQNRNMDVIDMEEKVINIRKRYKNEFSHALPGERVNQFFKVDKEFNNYLQRELRDRRDINQQLRQQKQRPFQQ
ncbi:MAG: hypothetical protein WKF97_26360 [Chitinophagaceae bacterium]